MNTLFFVILSLADIIKLKGDFFGIAIVLMILFSLDMLNVVIYQKFFNK